MLQRRRMFGHQHHDMAARPIRRIFATWHITLRRSRAAPVWTCARADARPLQGMTSDVHRPSKPGHAGRATENQKQRHRGR